MDAVGAKLGSDTKLTHEAELRSEANEWIARLTSGQATVADARSLEQWRSQSPRHATAFAEAAQVWEALGRVARQAAGADVRAPAGRGHDAGRRAIIGGMAAAAAVAAGYVAIRPPLGLWPSIFELTADYRTAIGERRRIGIADGVSLELNTRTSLKVDTASAGATRLELVAGEAAISTSQAVNQALVIIAAGGQVSATDANFNLRCDGDVASVTCLKGRVTVAYGGRVAALEPNHQIAYGKDGLGAPAVVDAGMVTAWRDGRLVFRGMPLSRVVDEVNRYRTGRIILLDPALGRRLVDASFPLDRTDELLDLVAEAYGARRTRLVGGIVLLG